MTKQGWCCGGNDPPLRELSLGTQAEVRELCKQGSRVGCEGMSGAASKLPPANLAQDAPGDPGSLHRMRDTAAAFPLAGSTSSEDEHVSQRHTDTERHTQTHVQDTQTDGPTACHRQDTATSSPTHRTPITHQHPQPRPLLLWGWHRRSLVQEHTHWGPLSTSTAPLLPGTPARILAL